VPPADAEPPPPTSPTPPADDLSRFSNGRSDRTNVEHAGTHDRYGRAEILVNAPIDTVRALVVDYGHYNDFTGGRFHISRVIGRSAAGTEVYFQLPILGGLVTLWQVFRFQELKPLAPGWSMIEGWYVKGNIGRGNAAWTLHAIDDERTLLTFDLLVVPSVPLPQSLLDEGLRNAAGAAVEAIRDRAQASAGPPSTAEISAPPAPR
jgi:hypothetical protein